MSLLNMPTVPNHKVDYLSQKGRRTVDRRAYRATRDMLLPPKVGRPLKEGSVIPYTGDDPDRAARLAKLESLAQRAQAELPLFD